MANSNKNKVNKSSNNILVIDDGNNGVSYNKWDIKSDYGKELCIDVLNEMYLEDHDIIFGIDTSDCITVINGSGIETSLHKYVKGTGLKFFKITDKLLKANDCEILINIDMMYNNLMSARCWSKHPKKSCERHLAEYPDILNTDIDGYKLCQEMLEPYKTYKVSDYDKPEAIELCDKEINIVIDGKDYKYRGYLPAAYQMICIFKCIDIMNYFIAYSGYTTYCGYIIMVPDSSLNECWTSNEYDRSDAYTIYPKWVNDKVEYCVKTSLKCAYHKVFPIFKEITDKSDK